MKKKLLQREIQTLDWTILVTAKILTGIGIGLLIATTFWYAQPYWYVFILAGGILLLLVLYRLLQAEVRTEEKLRKQE